MRRNLAYGLAGIFVALFAAVALADPLDTPATDAAKGLGGVLATGGGYGLSAVLFIAIYFREKKMDTLIERIIGMTEKQSTVLAENNLNMKRHNDLLEKRWDDRRGA